MAGGRRGKASLQVCLPAHFYVMSKWAKTAGERKQKRDLLAVDSRAGNTKGIEPYYTVCFVLEVPNSSALW